MEQEIFYIQGDGIGPEVMNAAREVLDAAVEKTYGSGRTLVWKELLAGEKAFEETGEYLPRETWDGLEKAGVAMKGPLTTPVGSGFRSLNVTLRQSLDLYACIRPVRHFSGIQSPVKHPEKVDMVVFRENTEDVYAGIEWAAGTPEAEKVVEFLRSEMNADVDKKSAVGIKPVTEAGCKRLCRRAFEFARDQGRKSVTLVHKGNIMKYTEGAFRAWGYELADDEFSGIFALEGKQGKGGIVLKDRIADAMFQEVLMRPEQYDVIATTNLNGDYISDALAAQVGGLGIAPGVNMGDDLALFEATHGTAPTIAGKDMANPMSMILSGAMLLEHIGWPEAAGKIYSAADSVLSSGRVTADLAPQMQGAKKVGCREFTDSILGVL